MSAVRTSPILRTAKTLFSMRSALSVRFMWRSMMREKEGGGVCAVEADNVRGCSVNGLCEHDAVAHIARGREAEPADEAGTEVGEDVSVKVWHDQDVELARVSDEEVDGVCR
jgi:hypothetical protein